MKNNPYVDAVSRILEAMQREREEQDNSQQEPTTEETPTMYVYRTDVGGYLISPVKIEQDPQEPEDEPVVESTPPPTASDSLTTNSSQSRFSSFMHTLCILLLFFCLDNVNGVLAQFAPTVTLTITPIMRTVTKTAALQTNVIHGRVLTPLTVSQSQTVKATGKGHQNATTAQGELLFYNGSFSAITIDAGTIYTGTDRIQATTNATVTVPAATTGNPPQFGKASVQATATAPGAAGNIPPGDIAITGSTLEVRNTAFHGGQDARNFTYVTQDDIQTVVSRLTPQLMQSEQAAFTAQLTSNEAMLPPDCTQRNQANHTPGDEAQTVTVMVSQTCTAFAYQPGLLQPIGMRILAARDPQFQLVGVMHCSVISHSGTSMTVRFIGTWVYYLDERHIAAAIAGKPRLTALHMLSTFPGIKTVSLSGVNGNDQLPTDAAHIHVTIFYVV